MTKKINNKHSASSITNIAKILGIGLYRARNLKPVVRVMLGVFFMVIGYIEWSKNPTKYKDIKGAEEVARIVNLGKK